MASELIVQTLKGPTSGANANKVIIPSGQTLDIDAWTPPAGTVLQVVQGLKTLETSTTSSSYADSGLTASITPSSTSSKILVYMSSNIQCDYSGTAGNAYIGLFKDSDSSPLASSRFEWNALNRSTFIATINYLDSPATTSSVTYKMKGRTTVGTLKFNDGGETNGASITLMEIAG